MNRFPTILTVLLLAAASTSAPAATRHDAVLLDQPGETHSGAPISIDVKDADLTDLLRLFADIGDVNLVVDPSVKGKTITLRLDEVPWDQALALVLQTHGLSGVHDGNVLRVAPSSKLVAEEQQREQLRQAREQSGPLTTIAVPMSYASAAQAEAIVRKSLTPRGTVTVDRRTNTLLITDVFPGSEGLGDLVEILPAPRRAEAAAAAEPTSLSYHLKLFEVGGGIPEGTEPSEIGSLSGARLVDDAHVVLGLEQKADVVLEDENAVSATIMLSPRRDGRKTVLAFRGLGSTGRGPGQTITRLIAEGREEAVVLPSHGSGTTLVVVLAPA